MNSDQSPESASHLWGQGRCAAGCPLPAITQLGSFQSSFKKEEEEHDGERERGMNWKVALAVCKMDSWTGAAVSAGSSAWCSAMT